MSYQVTYWTLNKGQKPKKTTAPCFATLSYAAPCDTVRYMANVDNDVTDDHIAKYLSFLREILDGTKWKEKPMKGLANGPTARRLYYVLDSTGMRPVKRLLYLTALRYIDEFPEIVIRFADAAGTCATPDDRFKLFQELHQQGESGGFKCKYGNFAGHGLISSYYQKGRSTIASFQSKVDTATRVNSMFT